MITSRKWDSMRVTPDAAHPDGSTDAGAATAEKRKGSFLREVAIIVVSALVLSWVIKSFFVQAFFIPSSSMEDTLVEGDRVTCCDSEGRVAVNGQSIDEPYIKPGSAPSLLEFDQTVPEGFLWVMGDNRAHSSDSRYNAGSPGGGFVPVDNVVGTAFVKVWPFDHLGWLRNPGETFEDVPAP